MDFLRLLHFSTGQVECKSSAAFFGFTRSNVQTLGEFDLSRILLPPLANPSYLHLQVTLHNGSFCSAVHAVNAVLDVLGRPQLTKEQIDDINRNLAASESFILAARIPPDNIVQPAGKYPINVLTFALQAYGGCSVECVTHLPVQPRFYLTGNGQHLANGRVRAHRTMGRER